MIVECRRQKLVFAVAIDIRYSQARDVTLKIKKTIVFVGEQNAIHQGHSTLFPGAKHFDVNSIGPTILNHFND